MELVPTPLWLAAMACPCLAEEEVAEEEEVVEEEGEGGQEGAFSPRYPPLPVAIIQGVGVKGLPSPPLCLMATIPTSSPSTTPRRLSGIKGTPQVLQQPRSLSWNLSRSRLITTSALTISARTYSFAQRSGLSHPPSPILC